jgi:hypothetical protein
MTGAFAPGVAPALVAVSSGAVSSTTAVPAGVFRASERSPSTAPVSVGAALAAMPTGVRAFAPPSVAVEASDSCSDLDATDATGPLGPRIAPERAADATSGGAAVNPGAGREAGSPEPAMREAVVGSAGGRGVDCGTTVWETGAIPEVGVGAAGRASCRSRGFAGEVADVATSDRGGVAGATGVIGAGFDATAGGLSLGPAGVAVAGPRDDDPESADFPDGFDGPGVPARSSPDAGASAFFACPGGVFAGP